MIQSDSDPASFESDASSKTCIPCRVRKVRCDGVRPQCGRCERSRRDLQCAYPLPDANTKHYRGSLRKGFACLTCRRKKKRCDGQRPFCQTCKNSGRKDECEYDLSPGPSDRDVIHEINSHQYTPSFDEENPPEWDNEENEYKGIPVLEENVSPSLQQAFSQPPHTNFPDDLTCETDSNYMYRRIFLTRLVQLGLHLSTSEKGAVLHGSCEAADIHPFFIHAAHLLGYLIHLRTQGQNLTGGKLQVYLNNALYSLAEVESDSYTMVQACYILSFFHMSCENVEMANKYLCDAASVAKGIGLSFDSSVTGGPSSDDARQRIIVLMIQLVYLENYLYVVLNHPPRHFVELEAQMVVFNKRDSRARFCPLALRAQAMLLVKEAHELKAYYQGDLQLQWTVAFKRLVHSFSEHIRTILPVIHESDRQGDRVTFVNLKCSVVACLAAEAELHLLLALSGHSESVRDYKHLTMKTVEVLRGLDQKDSEFLDPFMTIYWNKAIFQTKATHLI